MEWVYGVHAVHALLARGRAVQEIWVLAGAAPERRLQDVQALARNQGLQVRHVDRRALDELAGGGNHQGVAVAVVPAQPRNEGDLSEHLADLHEPPFLLVLDGVQDPHNLGACLRSADGAGAHGVIVPKDKVVGLTPTVRKVACGAAEFVPLFQVTNLARTLRDLKDVGVWLTGFAGEAEKTLYDVDLRGPLALVMGAEGHGLRRLTREHCDNLARIPMHGSVESLNVSAATAIALYVARRARGS